jgi:hypothetical protein
MFTPQFSRLKVLIMRAPCGIRGLQSCGSILISPLRLMSSSAASELDREREEIRQAARRR